MKLVLLIALAALVSCASAQVQVSTFDEFTIAVNTTNSSIAGSLCSSENEYWCPTGQCCSVNGVCGSTDEYCSPLNNCVYNCWSCATYGCPDGECCSQYGYCGSSATYCATSQGCQANCVIDPNGGSVTVDSRLNGGTLSAGDIAYINVTTNGTYNFANCPHEAKVYNASLSTKNYLYSYFFNDYPSGLDNWNVQPLYVSFDTPGNYYIRLNSNCSVPYLNPSPNPSWQFTVTGSVDYSAYTKRSEAADEEVHREKRVAIGNWNPTWKNVIYIYQLIAQSNLPKSLLVPGYSGTTSHNYNVINLAFWLSKGFKADQYSAAGYWARLGASTQQTYARAYHNAGVKVLVSAFGATDNPTSLSAYTVAMKLGAFVKNNNLDGADIDYEAPSQYANCKGCFSASWVINFNKVLRTQLPKGQYLITHAPQSPHFGTDAGAASDFPDGAYNTIHKQVGSNIDWYNIQYYNNDNVASCGDLFWKKTGGYGLQVAVFELITRTNTPIPQSQIVVGKPVGTSSRHDGNGFISAGSFAKCLREARICGKSGTYYTAGGVSGWEYYYDSPAVRWSQTLDAAFKWKLPYSGYNCPTY